ncbi:MAG TPA: hypothetical protein VNM90_26170 [Haliangium sp.]|nr:hypothetical protein [Haliangium sp.]
MQCLVGSVVMGALLLAGQGCYQTVVRSGAQRSGPTHEDRQWFTLAGLVGLSGPAGHECGEQGIAYAESEMSGMDILINLGVVLAGVAVGAAVCGEADVDGETTTDPLCVNSFATIAPLLLSSRTVRYGCAAGSTQNMQLMPGTPVAPGVQGTEGSVPPPQPAPAPLAPVAPVPPTPATPLVAPPDGAPERAPAEVPQPGTDPGRSR